MKNFLATIFVFLAPLPLVGLTNQMEEVIQKAKFCVELQHGTAHIKSYGKNQSEAVLRASVIAKNLIHNHNLPPTMVLSSGFKKGESLDRTEVDCKYRILR